jgi:hypothetical protein
MTDLGGVGEWRQCSWRRKILPPTTAVALNAVASSAVVLGAVVLGAVDLGAVDLGAVDLGAVDLGQCGLLALPGPPTGWRRGRRWSTGGRVGNVAWGSDWYQ